MPRSRRGKNITLSWGWIPNVCCPGVSRQFAARGGGGRRRVEPIFSFANSWLGSKPAPPQIKGTQVFSCPRDLPVAVAQSKATDLAEEGRRLRAGLRAGCLENPEGRFAFRPPCLDPAQGFSILIHRSAQPFHFSCPPHFSSTLSHTFTRPLVPRRLQFSNLYPNPFDRPPTPPNSHTPSTDPLLHPLAHSSIQWPPTHAPPQQINTPTHSSPPTHKGTTLWDPLGASHLHTANKIAANLRV